MPKKPTTYWNYVRVEDLLTLQNGLADSESELGNDEVMFITIHQIDELWFKLILRELVSVRNLFALPRVREQSLASAARGIRRVAILLHQVAQHFALMETMTTRDYLAFRGKLASASGFQSAQLREIEILCGLPDGQRISFGNAQSYMRALRNPDGTPSEASARVEARLADKPSLLDAIRGWVHRTPIEGSTPGDVGDEEVVASFIDAYCKAHARATRAAMEAARTDPTTPEEQAKREARYEAEIVGARAFLMAEDVEGEKERAFASRVRAALVFIESYRELPLMAWPREILEGIVAFEQAFVIFRQRHARMVERMIGRRTGTGGSAGVDYLDQTALNYRVFGEVWAVRTILVEQGFLPVLRNPGFYGFTAVPVSIMPPPSSSRRY